MHGEVVAQVDRAAPLDDHRGVTTDRAEPATQFLRVVDRGGQADEAHLGRGEDEHLLPDAAAVGVLNEVDLVEDDGVQALEQVRAGQQHVAQHLGRHHDHGRPRAQGGVAGQEADVIVAVGGDQLRILLVRQRLERRGVEGLAAGAEGAAHAEGGDERLARPGRRRDEHGVAGVQGIDGLALEVVESER